MEEREYRKRRERQERAAAEKADSSIAKKVHTELADRHAALAGDEAEPSKVTRDC